MKNKCCGGKCHKEKTNATNEAIGFLIIGLVLLVSMVIFANMIF